MTDAERFLALFPSNPQSYVVRKSTGARGENGKIPAEYATRRGGVTPALIDLHLDGKQCLVLKPDLPDGTCQWGTLDHDHYSGQTVAILADEIRAQCLPLYPFRSKSGGMHDFFFLRSPQPISRVRAQLGFYAKVLNDPDCEIFPKPVAKNKQAFGMCMPFFGRRDAFREFYPEPYDGPLGEAPEEEPRVFSEPGRPLPAGLLEMVLGKLNYEKRVEGTATFYDYHGLRGKDGMWQECLVAGRVHDAHRDNPRQATWKIANGTIAHMCFHAECQGRAGSHTKIALRALGLENFKAPNGAPSRTTNPWARAVGMDVFLSGEEETIDFLYNGMIAKGAITEVFSPRGLGKSLWAAHVAVQLARKGSRVMLIDRDNPRRVVREWLRAFGATVELTTLKFLPREDAPPLTDAKAWAEFPYLEYDVIILDSLDSAAEGVGEQDSSKPSKAIAPLLDIARREDGPAVLVLGNCVRTAARSRGSGVVEDRADIVFEVRDATDFHPAGMKPWIEELPAGGADHWAARSSRRKRREKYRLAFIATKFRLGEEPDPFVLEIAVKTEPWTIEDVTDAVDAEGSAAREQREKEHAETISRARASLVAELERRQEAQEPIMLKGKDAVPFLLKSGLKRNAARQLLGDPRGAWECRNIEGPKGHPIGVFLPSRPGEKSNGGGNTTPQKPAKNAGLFDADFAHPHPEHPAEIPPFHPVENKSVETPPISAATTKLTSPDEVSANASEEGEL
jgi:hypothetical protein